MGYEYKSQKSVLKKKANKVIERLRGNYKIIAVAFILVLIALLVSTSVLGFIAYSKDLEQKLDVTKKNLTENIKAKQSCETLLVHCAEKKDQCADDLNTTANKLSVCESNVVTWQNKYANKSEALNETRDDLAICHVEHNETRNTLSACNDDKETLKDLKNQFKDDFDLLGKNSAQEICCVGVSNTTEVTYKIDDDNEVVCDVSTSDADDSVTCT